MTRRTGATALRLLQRLRLLGEHVPEGSFVVRTYVTKDVRRAGAWSWQVIDPDGLPLGIGGSQPMTELVQGELAIKSEVSLFGTTVRSVHAVINR